MGSASLQEETSVGTPRKGHQGGARQWHLQARKSALTRSQHGHLDHGLQPLEPEKTVWLLGPPSHGSWSWQPVLAGKVTEDVGHHHCWWWKTAQPCARVHGRSTALRVTGASQAAPPLGSPQGNGGTHSSRDLHRALRVSPGNKKPAHTRSTRPVLRRPRRQAHQPEADGGFSTFKDPEETRSSAPVTRRRAPTKKKRPQTTRSEGDVQSLREDAHWGSAAGAARRATARDLHAGRHLV